MVDKTDDVSSGEHFKLPQQVTVLQAVDVPKASPEALHLLKSIGKQYTFFVRHIFLPL